MITNLSHLWVSKTAAMRIREAGNRPSGFDYMRLLLAISIVVWHTVKISYGDRYEVEIWNGPARPLLGAILPMFFALSGFLVAGSYARCGSVASFMFLRLIRIFPALAFETFVSALLIGPLFTTNHLASYFASSDFARYFLNIFGDVHYRLPGVFEGNPSSGTVNGQLWTVPFELKCYILVAGLAVIGLLRSWKLCLAVLIALQIVMLQRASVYGEVSAAVPGNVLVLCFLSGFLFYQIKNRLIINTPLFIYAVACHVALYMFKFGDYCIGLPDAYITVALGTLNPPRLRLLTSGDYSYGIYLYGFAIQQSVAALGAWTHNPATNLVLAGPLICLAACISWHVVEQPFLRFKSLVNRIDAEVGATRFGTRWLKLSVRPVEPA